MPQGVGIHQDWVFAGSDKVVAMTIDCFHEVSGGGQRAHPLIEAARSCFTLTGSGFHIFHPTIILARQQARYPESGPETLPVHPVEQGEPFRFPCASSRFVYDRTCAELKTRNRSAGVMPIGQAELCVHGFSDRFVEENSGERPAICRETEQDLRHLLPPLGDQLAPEPRQDREILEQSKKPMTWLVA